MLTGHLDFAEHHCLAGWAADSDQPNRRVELVVLVDGAELGRITADEPRPDLAAMGTLGDGRHGFRYYFDIPLTITCTYNIVVRFAETGALLPRGQMNLAKRAVRFNDDLNPILVSAAGRSGSTLLMRRLNTAPGIVIADRFPYEMKLISYLSKSFDVLTSPFAGPDGPQPQRIYEDPFVLGLNPFHHKDFEELFSNRDTLFHYYRDHAAPIIGLAFQQVIAGFYRKLREEQGKHSAHFFAEKCSLFDPIRNFVRSIYPDMKEIVLIRDPRDTYCSYRAFWSTAPANAMQAMRVLRGVIGEIQQERDRNLLFLRYEDMVADPMTTLRRLSDFLALGQVIQTDAAAEVELFRVHGTSENAKASIGRWRTELASDEISVFESEFGDILQRFDYRI